MKRKGFKKGAASFYIVAFSTLILMILATSFAAVIISSLDRTTNDDLSQSAYDSAMAGIEDAKLAFYSYQNCMAQENISPDCATIINEMHNPDCDMVRDMLKRSGSNRADIQENVGGNKNIDNNMEQSYTCAIINDSLSDYRSTLSASNMTKVVKARFEGLEASEIKKVEISWYSDVGNVFNYGNYNGSSVSFAPSSTGASVPPTISVALVQTVSPFSFSDFDMTKGNQTNRGMVYLVPTGSALASGKTANYKGAYKNGRNYIGTEGFLTSNDKTMTNTNLPYAVYCPRNVESEFACTATIEIPDPVGASASTPRSNDTFMFVVGLPYGKPSTDFAMKFYCADGLECGPNSGNNGMAQNQARLKGVQVEVDSTGRANDLYRRVITRLENTDDYALSIMGPLELLGSAGGFSLNKNDIVTTEWNFTN